MSIKLHLNVGDRVRNINKRSSRYRKEGKVYSSDTKKYYVIYDNTVSQVYYRDMAHMYLEKVEESDKASAGVPGGYPWDFSRLEERLISHYLSQAKAQPSRITLKKVRRNVITGKTQDDMIKICGSSAIGVHQFNTRATGRSTGEAYRIVGTAMCNPGKVFSYRNADHVFTEGTQTPHRANDEFFRTILDVIGDKRGFTCNKQDCTIMFNPIVTEETYVTRSN